MTTPSSKSCLAIALFALGTSAAFADAGAIGPGFTGAWFDPAQSGHGLFIEILPEQPHPGRVVRVQSVRHRASVVWRGNLRRQHRNTHVGRAAYGWTLDS